MRIYLADLGHNLITATSDTYPLGVGNLATYAQAYAKTAPRRSRSRSFVTRRELKAAIDAAPPDITGFSSYSWNHRLALSFARLCRGERPGRADPDGGAELSAHRSRAGGVDAHDAADRHACARARPTRASGRS